MFIYTICLTQSFTFIFTLSEKLAGEIKKISVIYKCLNIRNIALKMNCLKLRKYLKTNITVKKSLFVETNIDLKHIIHELI